MKIGTEGFYFMALMTLKDTKFVHHDCPELIFYMVQARVRLQVMEIIIENHARMWKGKIQIHLYIEL